MPEFIRIKQVDDVCFSAAQLAAAEEMLPILPQVRRVTTRVLDTVALSGERIEPDSKTGRHAPCWLHRAASSSTPKPVVFEIHGGGFALGDARKEDQLCAWIARSFDVNVVCVEYRQAPEFPYPAALEDVLATIRYFLDNAETFNMDRTHFYLFGCSAGADLSIASAIKLSDKQACPLAGCILHYPFFDASRKAINQAQGQVLTLSDLSLPDQLMEAFDVWYVGDSQATNPFISPIYATEDALKNLPFISLYPVLGDSLFVDAQRMCLRLAEAGVAFSFHPVEGAYHGYVEDAANTEVYYATTLPETIAARPKGFVKAAEVAVRTSLEEVLGPAKRIIPFKEL